VGSQGQECFDLLLSIWPFGELRGFIEYKAKLAGVILFAIKFPDLSDHDYDTQPRPGYHATHTATPCFFSSAE
jgi:hypothetical protein